MAYAITKAGVRWFLDSYPMPVPLNLMALVETDLLGGKEIILLENNYIVHSSCEKYMCNL